MKTLIPILILLFSNFTFADVECPGGIVFDSEIVVDMDKNTSVSLLLNGVGKQRVFIFDIMYSALYVEQLTDNNKTLILPNEVKVITIHALRNISEKRLRDAWDEEFETRCADQCDELLPYHEELLSYARDINKNERLSMAFFPDRLELLLSSGEVFPPIYSPEYGQLMMESAIGDDPASDSLKDGMMGQNKNLCQEI